MPPFQRRWRRAKANSFELLDSGSDDFFGEEDPEWIFMPDGTRIRRGVSTDANDTTPFPGRPPGKRKQTRPNRPQSEETPFSWGPTKLLATVGPDDPSVVIHSNPRLSRVRNKFKKYSKSGKEKVPMDAFFCDLEKPKRLFLKFKSSGQVAQKSKISVPLGSNSHFRKRHKDTFERLRGSLKISAHRSQFSARKKLLRLIRKRLQSKSRQYLKRVQTYLVSQTFSLRGDVTDEVCKYLAAYGNRLFQVQSPPSYTAVKWLLRKAAFVCSTLSKLSELKHLASG